MRLIYCRDFLIFSLLVILKNLGGIFLSVCNLNEIYRGKEAILGDIRKRFNLSILDRLSIFEANDNIDGLIKLIARIFDIHPIRINHIFEFL